MEKRITIFLIISVAIHLPLAALVMGYPTIKREPGLFIQFTQPEKENSPRQEKVVTKPKPLIRKVEERKPVEPPKPVEEKLPEPVMDPVLSVPETDPPPEGVPTEASHPSVPSESAAPVPAILPAGPTDSSREPETSSSPTPENSSVDVNALRQNYFQEVIRRIEHNKEYPRIAIHRGWEGRVRISFTIKGDGSIDQIRVVSRSDYVVLDEAAVAAVNMANPLPAPPQELQPPLTLRVDLIFRLNG